MAKMQFGTDTLTGLNVAVATHKMAPHELQESVNGWTDKEGRWRVAQGPTELYHGYTAISCFASGRMNGADHLVWMDGDTVYDNGLNVGTITAGSTMKIVAIDDKFLILGGTVNYIYDGNHIREHGALQPEYMSCSCWSGDTPTASNITGITAASPCVVTFTAHDLIVGDRVYITGVVGMTEINDGYYYITAEDSTTITLDLDSSGFTPYTSAGTADSRSGLDGVYKWYITSVVELTDGRVLESRPRGLRMMDLAAAAPVDYPEFGPDDGWEADEVVLKSSDFVSIGYDWTANSNDWKLFTAYGGAAVFDISGTQGTDWVPGIRLYRTKAGGTDFYLDREFWQGDAVVSTFSDATGGGLKFPRVYGNKKDIDLGAVYTASATDHSNPPVSSLAVTVGQLLFVNDTSNPDRYWWSHLDGIEYFNPLNWNTVRDAITELSLLGREVVIWSQDRLWADRFTGGAPDLREIITDTGATPGDVSVTTDDGVLLLSRDGLWLFDGARVTKISRRGFDGIDTPTSIAATGDTVYMSGAHKSYVVRQTDSGMVWHEGTAEYAKCDSTGGNFYAASARDIVKLFAGERDGGTFTTAAFSTGKEVQVDRVILDIEGPTVPMVWVNGNRQSDDVPHIADSTDEAGARRRVWVEIPHLSNHLFYVKVEATGDLYAYGVWLEVVG
ncbi:MAG TPA: ubiquitin-activating E1 FCCH domain-containing protein [Sedimentisphaerales bacterium]|nr:ubiquitin-activating E1 FCCH domain-containing protein [Sedimentisphaerales bacterium]